MNKMKKKVLVDAIKDELETFRSHDVDEQILSRIKNADLKSEMIANKLNINDLHILQIIGTATNIRISDIADHVPLTQGAVSKIINKLSDDALILKKHRPTNKKDTYVELTDNGLKINDIHNHYHQKMDQQLIGFADEFSKDDLKVVDEFLKKINLIRNID
jgi:DNA-binding MarR family transcriptional regulator